MQRLNDSPYSEGFEKVWALVITYDSLGVKALCVSSFFVLLGASSVLVPWLRAVDVYCGMHGWSSPMISLLGV